MKRAKTVKQMAVRQSLLVAGLALASLATSHIALAAPAIVGSWHIDQADFKAVATFMGDGTYFTAADAIGDSAHTGIEWGNYSWNEITGEVTATSLGDTNGNWGLANDVSGPIYMSISGNTATSTQPGCSECGMVAGRVLHSAGSIVGTWLFPPDVGSITFFADGSYIHGQEANEFGFSGIERGTYSWDSVTGALVATSIIIDTNGESGLSHPQGGIPLIVSLNVNGGLDITEGGNHFELVAGPVPEAETYAMMLAGLGLVGFAARRRAAV